MQAAIGQAQLPADIGARMTILGSRETVAQSQTVSPDPVRASACRSTSLNIPLVQRPRRPKAGACMTVKSDHQSDDE